MIWPILLIFVAVAAAGSVAFGTHPAWANLEHGLEVILWSRRLQWLLVAATVAACVGLIAMSVADRRRAVWLLGLAPVLMLLAHRFAAGRPENAAVVEDPAFVEAAKVDFVRDDDWVVALRFGDRAYAYPYAALFVEPVVVQAAHDKRLALFWNAYANRAVAFNVNPDFRGRDLEVVSTPANALLLYNARAGQFLCGVTGLTPDRQKPTGLGRPVPTTKTTFAAWRSANAGGLVMRPSGRIAALGLTPPTRPVAPAFGMYARPTTVPATGPATTLAAGPSPCAAGGRRVAVVGSARPLAVDVATLSLDPATARVGDVPAVLLRADAGGSGLRAFARKLDDLSLRFEPCRDPKHLDVRMGDAETGSLWSAAGVAVGGTPQFRGRRLQPLPVDEDVDLDVMRWWVPDLEVYAPPPRPAPAQAGAPAQDAAKPAKKPRPRRAAPATQAASARRPNR